MFHYKNSYLNVTLGLAFSFAFLIGCGSSKDSAARVPVSGEVTLDGRPLTGSMIVMVSLSETSPTKATGIVKNGKFEITQPNGPVAGENRVHIYPVAVELEELENKGKGINPKDLFQQKCPAKYGKKSQLKVDIPKGGGQAIKIKLTT